MRARHVPRFYSPQDELLRRVDTGEVVPGRMCHSNRIACILMAMHSHPIELLGNLGREYRRIREIHRQGGEKAKNRRRFERQIEKVGERFESLLHRWVVDTQTREAWREFLYHGGPEPIESVSQPPLFVGATETGSRIEVRETREGGHDVIVDGVTLEHHDVRWTAQVDRFAIVVIGGTNLMGGRGGIGLTLLGMLTIGYLEKILSINAVPEAGDHSTHGAHIELRDIDNAEVPQAGPALWHENRFRVTNHRQLFRVNLGNEQWSAMTEHVVVAGALARVHKKQSIAMRHPVLLRVVVSQVGAIIKCPAFWLVEIQSILTGCDVAVFIIS